VAYRGAGKTVDTAAAEPQSGSLQTASSGTAVPPEGRRYRMPRREWQGLGCHIGRRGLSKRPRSAVARFTTERARSTTGTSIIAPSNCTAPNPAA
jgi:hypothetical protein